MRSPGLARPPIHGRRRCAGWARSKAVTYRNTYGFGVGENASVPRKLFCCDSRCCTTQNRSWVFVIVGGLAPFGANLRVVMTFLSCRYVGRLRSSIYAKAISLQCCQPILSRASNTSARSLPTTARQRSCPGTSWPSGWRATQARIPPPCRILNPPWQKRSLVLHRSLGPFISPVVAR